ncbi:MAG: DUF1217 domain-containing protein [Alphaproteobacteria bacterium]
MANALSLYQSVERADPARSLTKFRSSAAITREVEYFKSQIASIKTPDDLYKNRRMMGFVLSAYGLDTEINFIGRIKAVLNSDLTDTKSTANILKDNRYREIAAALDIKRTGLSTLKLPATIDKLAERFISAEYEKSLGKQDPAVREARYFAQNIGKVTDVYQILADKVLRKVVLDTLAIPEQVAIQPIETQAEIIKRRLDISQFRPSGAGAAAQQSRADLQADVTALERAQAAAAAAATRAGEIGQRLRDAAGRYDGLAALQDPNGANAATIPVHDVAIPQLLRQQGLAAAAEASIGQLADGLNRLSALRRLAADPANAGSLADYKAEFAAVAASMRGELSTGASHRFDGQDENLLDGSLAGDLATTIDTAGTTVTLRRQDLSGFLAEVDAADAAFAAVADAGDAANLGAVADAISRGGPQLGAARDQVLDDREAMETRISGVGNFTSTLDSVALQRARSSVIDADDRARQVATKLTALRQLAVDAAAATDQATRQSLDDQAQVAIAEITTMLATPGTGLDNLLGAADANYALPGGKNLTLRGRDLQATIGAVLGGANLKSTAKAEQLRDAISADLVPAITDARARMAIDRKVADSAANVLDPRGRIDESVRALRAEAEAIVARASSNGTNLLVTGQRDIVVRQKVGGAVLTVEAAPAFRDKVMADMASAIASLPGDPAAARATLASLASHAGDVESALRASRARVDFSLGEARRKLSAMPAADSSGTAQQTEFTKRFIQRFLSLRDAKSATDAAAGATGPGSEYLALFA